MSIQYEGYGDKGLADVFEKAVAQSRAADQGYTRFIYFYASVLAALPILGAVAHYTGLDQVGHAASISVPAKEPTQVQPECKKNNTLTVRKTKLSP